MQGALKSAENGALVKDILDQIKRFRCELAPQGFAPSLLCAAFGMLRFGPFVNLLEPLMIPLRLLHGQRLHAVQWRTTGLTTQRVVPRVQHQHGPCAAMTAGGDFCG